MVIAYYTYAHPRCSLGHTMRHLTDLSSGRHSKQHTSDNAIDYLSFPPNTAPMFKCVALCFGNNL